MNVALPPSPKIGRGWYVCGMCGYLARSMPFDGEYDDEGKEIGARAHDCPDCGDSYWLMVEGFGRKMRWQIFLDGRWDKVWR